VFTEPPPNNESRDTYIYRYAHWWEGLMKYADEMRSGTTIYISSFIKISSGIRKSRGDDSQTHRHTDSMEIA
jgi:hypothetical protein